MNLKINKNRFKTLGKELAKNGINIKYMVDWSDPERSYTDQPYLGSGTYNGIEEKKLIKEILLKRGFKFKGIDDYEVEWDNDRSYPPSISFINNK